MTSPAGVTVSHACCSPGFDAWPIEGVRRLQAVTPGQETASFVEDLVRLIADVGVSHKEGMGAETLAGYLDPWRDDPPAFFRAARGIEGKGLDPQGEDLAKLDIPTLIMWGEDDPFLPVSLAERLQEALPGSTLALLPGCSHFVTEDAPGTVGPLVYEFLRARYLGETHSHAPAGGPVPVFLERPGAGPSPQDDQGDSGG